MELQLLGIFPGIKMMCLEVLGERERDSGFLHVHYLWMEWDQQFTIYQILFSLEPG